MTGRHRLEDLAGMAPNIRRRLVDGLYLRAQRGLPTGDQYTARHADLDAELRELTP